MVKNFNFVTCRQQKQGNSGFCGVYIYRVTENTDPEVFEYTDEDSIVRMDDGRVYILHEGD